MHPFSGGVGASDMYMFCMYLLHSHQKSPLSTEEEEACVWDVYFWGVRLFCRLDFQPFEGVRFSGPPPNNGWITGP